MSIDETVKSCIKLITDDNFTYARDWKKVNNKKVVGNFPVYMPKELVHAAGMLPVTIMGFGSLEIRYADSLIQSGICSITRSTLELGLTKKLDFLDALIFPYICDDARNLAHFSSWRQSLPNTKIIHLDLPQNPAFSLGYYLYELEKLGKGLEDISGALITDEKLGISIAKYNLNRELIRTLYNIKRETPWKISMLETYALVKAGNVLPVEGHNTILREVIDKLPGRRQKKRDNARIVVEGAICEQPPLDVIREIEDAGCYIVDDDFIVGSRLVGCVSTKKNPLEALAEAYLDDSVYLAVKYDEKNNKKERFLRKVQKARADAVLFLYPKFCKPVEYDMVLFQNELRKHGIRYLAIEYEEKMTSKIKDKIEPFSESVLLKDMENLPF